MDLATVIGLLVTSGLLIGTIIMGSPLIIFINPPSVMLVVLGTIAIMFVSYPAGKVKNAISVVKNAFRTRVKRNDEILRLMQQMASRARREGVLSLEEIANQQDDEFLKRGLLLVVDGHEPAAIEDVLYAEIDQISERHSQGVEFFETMGAMAPAMGMIGTLIGLVQMLQALDDPTAIGPAMAVALLTTLYGSIMANVFAIPISIKLKDRDKSEIEEKSLIVQGLLSIVNGENPRFLVDRLNAQLPPKERVREAS
jgi:chemotaxis protein MotA